MRRRARVLVPVLVVAGGAVAAFVVAGGGEPSRDGDRMSPVAGFEVTYRIETSVSGTEVSRRTVEVRRPFDGRDITVGATGSNTASGFVTVGRRLYLVRGEQALDFGERPPDVPPGDQRLAAVLPDLERLGLAMPRGTEEVLGRSCRVYRLGAPLGDPFRPPSADEHADVCVDGDGIVLSEDWTFEGRIIRRTRAVEVNVGVPGDDVFTVGTRQVVPNPTGIGRVDELPLDRIPDVHAPYWEAARPADGFRLTHRSRAMTFATTDGVLQLRDLVYVDTYERGADVVSVEHRERAGGEGGPQAGVEERVLPRLGRGQVVLTGRGAELHFTVEGWDLVVRGSVGVDDLVEFASRLAPRRA